MGLTNYSKAEPPNGRWKQKVNNAI